MLAFAVGRWMRHCGLRTIGGLVLNQEMIVKGNRHEKLGHRDIFLSLWRFYCLFLLLAGVT